MILLLCMKLKVPLRRKSDALTKNLPYETLAFLPVSALAGLFIKIKTMSRGKPRRRIVGSGSEGSTSPFEVIGVAIEETTFMRRDLVWTTEYPWIL